MDMIELLQNQVVFSGVLTAGILVAILTAVAYCIYFERKISARIQDRYGPNRVGPFGLLQPLADGAKFLLKEDIIPSHVDKPLFLLAPAISFILAMIGFAVIPWGGQVMIGDKLMNVQIADPGIGILYVLGVGSMGVYGIVLGGWASNNKYSTYGGVRATAQMLSYEIPMGIAILVVVLTCGEIRLERILTSQFSDGGLWFILLHPVAFFILLVTIFAETNRAPFDLAEAEQELVGGFHTEYSAMKFAMFFLAEYAHMITGSAVICVLFLGGWHLPFVPGLQVKDTGFWAMFLKLGVFGVKVAAFIFLFMWVRWTLPRFRFDQLMRLAWKGLIPMSLGVLLVAIIGLHYGWHDRIWFTLPGNVIVALIALWLAARSGEPLTGRQPGMVQMATSVSAGV